MAKTDTKEQAKKKALKLLGEKFSTYAEILEFSEFIKVRWQDTAGFKHKEFSFTEPKLDDLALCWNDGHRKAILRFNGKVWSGYVGYHEGDGAVYDNYELLGINIADKLEAHSD